jgi:hypothetical protein
MPNERSSIVNKKMIVPLGGLIVIICFFLPWIRACDTEISGLQLATDNDIGESIFWLILIIGIVIVGGFFVLKERSKLTTIISAIAGLLILLWKILVPVLKGEGKELGLSIQAGGYGTLLGLILSLLGETVHWKDKT